MNRGDLDSIDFHLIVEPCEIAKDSHEFDSFSFNSVLVPFQLGQLILHSSKKFVSIVIQ